MGERVLKNPFSRWLGFCSASQYRAARPRLALALLKMGKKSRRPARQDKRTEKKPTLDDLDEHTAKPCTCCLEQVALTEPRYLVCSGCGEARYCSELCQRVHWAKHQKVCPAGRPG